MENKRQHHIIHKKVMTKGVEIFCYICLLLFLFLVGYLIFSPDRGSYGYEIILYSTFFCLFGVVRIFTNVIAVRLNLTNKTYKKEYGLGPFRYGKWKELPNPDYVSVFVQLVSGDGEDLRNEGTNYNVNVWYERGKHFTIYSDFFPDPCFNLARMIAVKFNVGLLDATDSNPDNYTWIELNRNDEMPVELDTKV